MSENMISMECSLSIGWIGMKNWEMDLKLKRQHHQTPEGQAEYSGLDPTGNTWFPGRGWEQLSGVWEEYPQGGVEPGRNEEDQSYSEEQQALESDLSSVVKK